MTTAQTVLVTGAFGLVGSSAVAELVSRGHHVVATDLESPANRKAALKRPGVQASWADLTDVADVEKLLTSVAPQAIIHLAAVIPPLCYARPDIARAVNVGATENLVRAASVMPVPPRFVQASSVAVYGPRNPHRGMDVLTAQTPRRPTDVYGTQKAAAEDVVRASGLDWVILRLGGVLTAELGATINPDAVFFEASLPADGRIQTVDVRDVATAFVNACFIDEEPAVYLIGGDDSHRLRQSDIASATSAAIGLSGGFPAGRPGDPDNDPSWFATDWMDTATSQRVLAFQQHSFADLMSDTRRAAGWRRHVVRPASRLARAILTRRSPYRGYPGTFADPWGVVTAKWGPAASGE
jgi:nucleoside-diphosphate-sugar epimerase